MRVNQLVYGSGYISLIVDVDSENLHALMLRVLASGNLQDLDLADNNFSDLGRTNKWICIHYSWFIQTVPWLSISLDPEEPVAMHESYNAIDSYPLTGTKLLLVTTHDQKCVVQYLP